MSISTLYTNSIKQSSKVNAPFIWGGWGQKKKINAKCFVVVHVKRQSIRVENKMPCLWMNIEYVYTTISRDLLV